MKKGLFILVLILTILSLTNCSKEENLTDGEKIANEINKVIQDNKISTAVIYDTEFYAGQSQSVQIAYGNISVDGDFVIVGDHYFNLIQLDSYYINDGDIIMFFNGMNVH
jgi:hypothetical protein